MAHQMAWGTKKTLPTITVQVGLAVTMLQFYRLFSPIYLFSGITGYENTILSVTYCTNYTV
jgi:hypothetical protein